MNNETIKIDGRNLLMGGLNLVIATQKSFITNKLSNEKIAEIISNKMQKSYDYCEQKIKGFKSFIKLALKKVTDIIRANIKITDFDIEKGAYSIEITSDEVLQQLISALTTFDNELQAKLKAVEKTGPGPGVEPGPGAKKPFDYLQSLIANKMKALLKRIPALPKHLLKKLKADQYKEKEEFYSISNNIEKAINDTYTNMKQNISLFTETTSLRSSDMVNMNKNLNKQWVQDVVTNCFYMHQSTGSIKDEYKNKLTAILDSYIDKRKESPLKKKPFDRASFSTIIWTLTKYTPFEKLNDLIDKILDLIVNDLVDPALLITE